MKRQLVAISIISVLSLVGYQNCGNDASFTSSSKSSASAIQSNSSGGSSVASSSSGGSAPICSNPITPATNNLRIIFMVDNSGSTNTTDPQQYYRNQVIQTFLSQYSNNTSLSFAFGYFEGTSAYLFDGSSQSFVKNANQPFGGAGQLSSALTAYDKIRPNGNTPYHAGFNEIQNAILADLQSGSGSANYSVVFMSDGQPTDVSSSPSLTTNLVAMVQSFAGSIQAQHGAVAVSTVYFNPANNSGDSANLQAMAQAGGGQFVNTNVTSSLVIADLVSVPSTCP